MVKIDLDDMDDVLDKGKIILHMFDTISYCLKKIKYVLFKGWLY